jgi:two-component system KDP operon response regulator KdpE
LILIVVSGEHSRTKIQVEQLRAHTVVPIILISDPIPENEFVEYLEAGADQVVIRPYGVRTLSAQIKAVMRRSAGVPFFSLPILTQKEIQLDPSNRTVIVGKEDPKRLTQLEFRLLYTLMTHAGQIIPTERIVEHVWGYAGEGNTVLVRGLVQRLRTKVEPNPKKPVYIVTEPGIGYSFHK